MPDKRIQDGLKIAGSDDMFLAWKDMPQTLVATSESARKAITEKERELKISTIYYFLASRLAVRERFNRETEGSL